MRRDSHDPDRGAQRLGRDLGGLHASGLIESTVLLAAVGLPWLVLRRRISAQLSCGLFLLVLLKLAVPGPVTAPPLVARLSPRPAFDRLAGWATTGPATASPGPWSEPFATIPAPPGLASAPAGPGAGARTRSDRDMPRPSVAPDRIGAEDPAPRAPAV